MHLLLSQKLRGSTTGIRYIKSGGISGAAIKISYSAQELRDFLFHQISSTATASIAKEETLVTVPF